ncbi:hypothetical protein DW971_02265 [Veillonella parvula]|nr:hypothetical protein DW971_02265 [Veillonella parvula]
MMYKALVSFSGAVSASQDSIIEISDAEIANDLLNAGYIEQNENTDNNKDNNKGSKKDNDED